MSIAPCKDCTKRYLGCHDRCKDYQEFHKEQMELREIRRRRKDQFYGSLSINRKKKRRNKNGYCI